MKVAENGRANLFKETFEEKKVHNKTYSLII